MAKPCGWVQDYSMNIYSASNTPKPDLTVSTPHRAPSHHSESYLEEIHTHAPRIILGGRTGAQIREQLGNARLQGVRASCRDLLEQSEQGVLLDRLGVW